MNNFGVVVHMWRLILLVALAQVLTSSASGAAGIAAAGAEAAIIKDWQLRRNAFSHVQYTLKGTSTFPKNGCTSPTDKGAHPQVRVLFPETDVSLPFEGEFLMDFDGRRTRRIRHAGAVSLRTAEIRRAVDHMYFDGENSYRVVPKEHPYPLVTDYLEGAQVVKRSGLLPEIFTAKFHILLFAHGLAGGAWTKIFGKAQSPDFHAPIKSIGEAKLGNNVCRVVRVHHSPEVYEEFWIVPSMQSAVVRWKTVHDSRIAFQCDATYQAFDTSWLPESWIYTSFSSDINDQVREVEEVRVVAIKKDLALTKEDFSPTYRPKDLILEGGSREQKVVSEDGTLVPRGASAQQSRRWVWALICVIALAMLVGVYVYRRHYGRVTST